MKLRIEKDILAKAVTKAARVLKRPGGSFPSLSCILIQAEGDRITFTGSDLDTSIRTSITGTVTTPGAALVPGKMFSGAIDRLPPGAVTIELLPTGQVALTDGNVKMRFQTFTLDDYPKLSFEPDPDSASVNIETDQWNSEVGTVATAASKDDARPILTGVLIRKAGNDVVVVATDSYRLHVGKLTAEISGAPHGDIDALIPATLTKEIGNGSGPISLSLAARKLVAHTATATMETTITGRLIEGAYPPYQNLIPKSSEMKVRLGKTTIEAIKRISLFCDTPATPIRLTFTTDTFTISAVTADIGDGEEILDHDGTGFGDTPFRIAFNPVFLTEAIAYAGAEGGATMSIVDALKPVTLIDDTGRNLSLLMPVRVS